MVKKDFLTKKIKSSINFSPILIDLFLDFLRLSWRKSMKRAAAQTFEQYAFRGVIDSVRSGVKKRAELIYSGVPL